MSSPASSPLRLAVICPVVSATSGGGMERAVHTVVSELRKRCALTVIASRVEDLGDPAGVEWIRIPSVPIPHFLIEYATFRGAWHRYSRRISLSQHFDVTYSTSPLFDGTDFAAVHFNSTRYLKVMPKPTGSGATAKAVLKHGYHRGMHGIAARHERKYIGAIAAGRSRTRLLPVSDALAQTLREDFALPPETLQVVPNPLDLDRFRPGDETALRAEVCAAGGWTADSFILLFVGGGWKRKGLESAIDALPRLPDSVKLLVVGPGDAAAYRKLASERGVASRVAFAGVRSDVQRYYRIAGATILPSVFEALPLSCTEALASGLPAIVYPFPGSATLVESGVNGFIVDSPEGLATSVKTLLANTALRSRMSVAARASVQRFSPPAIADQLIRLFESKPRS